MQTAISSFRELYTAEMQELRSAAGQFSEALRQITGVIGSPDLKTAFTRHQKQVQAQIGQVESVLSGMDASLNSHTDQAMDGLINESLKMAKVVEGKALRDAALLASAQKLQHYLIAAFGNAAALAGQLDRRDDQKVLHQAVDAMRSADAEFTAIAKRSINPSAVAA